MNWISWYDAWAFSRWLGPEYALPSRKQYRDMIKSVYPNAREGSSEYAQGVASVFDYKALKEKICGLLSNVNEFVSDRSEYQGQVFELIVGNDANSFAFAIFPENGRDQSVGFRVARSAK